MNKIIVIGNLGRDPEMRYTPAGTAVTSFSLASNRTWTDASGQRRDHTEWFNCQAWGKLAEITNQHLAKGQQVYVEGRVSLRTYEKRDGGQGASLDVTVTELKFLGQRTGGNNGAGEAERAAVAAGHNVEDPDDLSPPDDVDDLPF